MTLLFVDGFDDLANWVAGANGTIVAGGRTGNCLQMTGSSTQCGYRIPAALASEYLAFGWAFRVSSISSQNGFINTYSDNGGTGQCILKINTNGSLEAFRASSSVATSAPGLLVINTWYYIEVQIRLHDTLGVFVVRVNGVPVINFSGDTKSATTNNVLDQLMLFNGTSLTSLWDDFYLMTGPGDALLGDCQVETLYPNGNGNANQWQGNDGNSTDNYLLVDEPGIDVADFVGAATPGEQDLYTLTNPTLRTGSVLAVCHQTLLARTAAGDTAGVTTFKQVNRGASDTQLTQTLGGSLTTYNYCLTTNPETGSPFTFAELDGLQTGVEVT